MFLARDERSGNSHSVDVHIVNTKNTPESVRRATVVSFRDTAAEMIRVTKYLTPTKETVLGIRRGSAGRKVLDRSDGKTFSLEFVALPSTSG